MEANHGLRSELPASHYSRKRRIYFTAMLALAVSCAIFLLVLGYSATMNEGESPLTDAHSVQLDAKPRGNAKSSGDQAGYGPFAPVKKVFGIAWRFMGSIAGWTGKMLGYAGRFLGKIFMGAWHSVHWIFAGIGRGFGWAWNSICHAFAFVLHGCGALFHTVARFFESMKLFQSPSPAPTKKPTHSSVGRPKPTYAEVHTKMMQIPTTSPTVRPTDAVPPPPLGPSEDVEVTPPPAGAPIFSPQVAI